MSIDFSAFTVKDNDTVLNTMLAIENGGRGLALVEYENREFAGLVTDGDIRRALLSGTDLHDTVKSILKENYITAIEGVPSENVLSLMNEKIRHIPILDRESRIKDVICFSYYVFLACDSMLFWRDRNRDWLYSVGRL